MPNARQWIFVLLMLFLFGLGLAACGGSSSGPANNGGTPAPTATKSGY